MGKRKKVAEPQDRHGEQPQKDTPRQDAGDLVEVLGERLPNQVIEVAVEHPPIPADNAKKALLELFVYFTY